MYEYCERGLMCPCIVVKLSNWFPFPCLLFVMYCIYCFMYFFVYKIVVVTDGQKIAKKIGI